MQCMSVIPIMRMSHNFAVVTADTVIAVKQALRQKKELSTEHIIKMQKPGCSSPTDKNKASFAPRIKNPLKEAVEYSVNITASHHLTGYRVCSLRCTRWGIKGKSWALSMVTIFTRCGSLRLKTSAAVGRRVNIMAICYITVTPGVWAWCDWVSEWLRHTMFAMIVRFSWLTFAQSKVLWVEPQPGLSSLWGLWVMS
jgi:hypothetical protein